MSNSVEVRCAALGKMVTFESGQDHCYCSRSAFRAEYTDGCTFEPALVQEAQTKLAEAKPAPTSSSQQPLSSR